MRVSLFLLVLAQGCDAFTVKASDDSGHGFGDSAEADTDADTDTDADSDTDSDADGDTDTDTDADLCDASLSSASPGGPGCYTGVLSCGDVVEATNEGGDSSYVGEDWESWFCTPNLDRHDYDSPERVYQMFIPARTTATFDFATPCEDLDLFVLYWADEDTCPTSGAITPECEAADNEEDRDTVSVWSDVGAQYLVIVDGRDGGTGNFRVSVTCEE
jgi:hypothetical protein